MPIGWYSTLYRSLHAPITARRYINHDDMQRARDACRVIEPRGVDKNSSWYLRETKKEIARRLVRHKEWTEWTAERNFRQVRARGKVTGRGSPPRVLTSTNLVWRTLTPLTTTWRESDVSPSRRSTLPAWFEATTRPWTFLGPSVYLPLPLALPSFSIPGRSLSLSLEISSARRRIAYTCLSVRRRFILPLLGNKSAMTQ